MPNAGSQRPAAGYLIGGVGRGGGSGLGVVVGWEELAAVGWAGGVDPMAELVNDSVVMEPTEGGEVRRVVGAAPGSVDDVVGLEPVAGATAGDSARPVSSQHEPSQSGWNRLGGRPDGQGGAVGAKGDDFDGAVTQDLLEGLGSDPRPGHDGDSGLAVGSGGGAGVAEDGDGHP